MASACVNNVSVSAYGCFNPRAASEKLIPPPLPKVSTEEEEFEFMSGDTAGMLPADELFSGGKLVTAVTAVVEVETEVSSGEESCLVSSPKAPRCSSKWRELLGLKRFSQNSKAATTTTFHSNPRSSTTASFKQFLNRSPKTLSSSEATSLISLPLLSDSESLSVSSSSRMSLSSSSSSQDHEDNNTPRLSLDAERLNHLANQTITANPFAPARPRMRLVKPRDREETCSDSPRLNSSGKIVYQSLERSSSSPSGTSGGGGYRNRGVERSYSANVRVAPVLNVPVCSVRGGSVIFSQFFSSASSSQHKHGGISRGRNSTDRVS
ncbi:Uncharacterized protein Rs2_03698 [Raphanus sativus]|uniref:Uncharacterized protein LOC108827374 n=1 Tax=Raphanus sativus TaxID=3726 RepID=A0A6J0L8R6_RAPSA|nr:uncharacterized protein LOC108827374 [Raphanus sativus]KAJ4909077.1 Uncharacterized protein Rs2_03698 [Raphanus sativus]